MRELMLTKREHLIALSFGGHIVFLKLLPFVWLMLSV